MKPVAENVKPHCLMSLVVLSQQNIAKVFVAKRLLDCQQALFSQASDATLFAMTSEKVGGNLFHELPF